MSKLPNPDNGTIATARAIEAIERDAWLDMFAAAPPSYVAASGVTHERLDDAAALADRGVAIAELNRVFSLGLEVPLTEESLDRAIAWLRANAASGWAIQLAPLAISETVGKWLNQRGLEKTGTGWAKFHRSSIATVTPAPLSPLEIKSVTPAFADDFGHVVQAGFGLPEATAPWFAALVGRAGWKAYLAFDGTRPVAAGAMFISGNRAWLGIDATLADARGRGGQSGIIAQRLRDGLASGVVGFTAETGNPPPGQEAAHKSYRNYLKAGFAVAYIRQNYKLEAKA
jgi:hypothetical protein